MIRLLTASIASTLLLVSPVLAQKTVEPPAKAAPPKTEPAKVDPAKTKPAPMEKTPAEKAPAEKAPAGDAAAQEAAWAKAAELGPVHKQLAFFEGEWAAVTQEPKADGKMTNDKGTLTGKMILGGRFLSLDYDGRANGKFFRGAGMWGYSNTDKQVEVAWADSMGTAMDKKTGNFDSAGKVLTLTGELTDPVSGRKMATKEVFTITGKDCLTLDVFMAPGGKETKTMSGTFTKASKSDSKPDAKPSDSKPAAEKPADKKPK